MSARVWRVVVLLGMSLLSGAGLSPGPLGAATFHGTIIDGETAEPLEGAVVIVIWWRVEYHVIHSRSVPYAVVEALTERDGRFSADASPGLLSPAFDTRVVVVYKPGYRPLGESTHDEQAPLFSQTMIGLTKVKTLREAREYLSGDKVGVYTCSSSVETSGCVPRASVPNLIRVLEIQKKIFNPYPDGFFGVE